MKAYQKRGCVFCKWQIHRSGASSTCQSSYQNTNHTTLKTELQHVLFALLHFRFAFVSHFFFHALLLHFGKGIFTLCHCTLKVCNFLFDFYRDLWLKFALRLTGGFGWGFLKSIETVKTTETHEMECLLYYEIEISLLGGQRWNTKV